MQHTTMTTITLRILLVAGTISLAASRCTNCINMTAVHERRQNEVKAALIKLMGFDPEKMPNSGNKQGVQPMVMHTLDEYEQNAMREVESMSVPSKDRSNTQHALFEIIDSISAKLSRAEKAQLQFRLRKPFGFEVVPIVTVRVFKRDSFEEATLLTSMDVRTPTRDNGMYEMDLPLQDVVSALQDEGRLELMLEVDVDGENLAAETSETPVLVVTLSPLSKRTRRGLNSCSETSKDCCRQQNVISFQHSGWSESLLMPKLLDIGSCAGDCTDHNDGLPQILTRGKLLGERTTCCYASEYAKAVVMFKKDGTVITSTLDNLVISKCRCA